MNSNLILVFLTAFIASASAGIEHLEKFKLAEQSLQDKSRFVFSDFNANSSKPLKNASIEIDVYAKPINYVTDDQNYAE